MLNKKVFYGKIGSYTLKEENIFRRYCILTRNMECSDKKKQKKIGSTFENWLLI